MGGCGAAGSEAASAGSAVLACGLRAEWARLGEWEAASWGEAKALDWALMEAAMALAAAMALE